ncbi:urea ABC transporter permease subunit UrtB [Oceanibacterium hippocampi]|uniref:High-affinity branched-chain amino acid transport system permease protein LivH n=1 Tax=Oceanibacterium hippocampi TaxID=745714 RepID=A0A1Y5TEI0_9PROT|nr:urea ABC transporter permease subunit UrtB [Oceanibacterium hippocampi]SLN61932.1 High-affinity branched-chain amino acid transport system permease protein LivH [Oceanibacterium hippocampi]
MIQICQRAIRLLLLLAAILAAGPFSANGARAGAFEDALPVLTGKGFAAVGEAVDALAASGDPRAIPVLEALSDGDLYYRESDKAVFLARKGGEGYLLTDPGTGEAAGTGARGDFQKIKTNNRLRVKIRTALGALGLFSPDPQVRIAAARSLFMDPDPALLPLVDDALSKDDDPGAREALDLARAAILIKAGEASTPADKVAAIRILSQSTSQGARALLGGILLDDGEGSEEVRQAAGKALQQIETRLSRLAFVENVFQGISLGSVLLLAAIGLAITFGVMGVINMAHGEMVMLGAYATYLVQETFRLHAPEALGWSLPIALPFAFLVAGAVGIAMERGVIRFLYGRPLETLLATWGISLVLQQLVRTIFGPTNREVSSPDWMSGTIEVTSGLLFTTNRLWIIAFALIVLFALMAVLRYTAFGLQMRAVTQNRRMANAMGIRSGWVDAFTFGLGSGIAGIAGVALSQIDNVSPNLGQSYIIDSFLVVVFGGVGNLWGTLVGAMSLGIVNKLLEPYSGAVLGKILVLIAVIMFIQKRPKGLFALKGRAVEN